MGLSANAEDSGTCGPNLKWHLTNNRVLTISGKGKMYNYSDDNRAPWSGDYIKRIIIGDGITTIGSYAFYNCSTLTSVTIPNSVTEIGGSAFAGCSALTSVTIPNSVTTIGWTAFEYCSSLTSVTISNSVTEIGASAFGDCRSLTSVTIPNSVMTIGWAAFENCSALTSVTIPNSVTTIGDDAFEDCRSLTSVTIPNSVTYIGDRAFTNNNAKIIWLTNTPPAGYRNVEGGIHYVTNNLYLGLSNKKVYPYLSSIFEVNGVKYVPVSERTCDALDCIYTGDPYEVKINKKINYKGIDMTVRDINPYTAYGCTNIKKAYIDINGSIGDNAFSGCTNLVSVDIKAGNNIGKWAFSACSRLKNFTFGSGLQSIEREAFSNCTNITQISSEAVVPPTCGINALDDINKWDCKLFVPKASIDAYKQAPQWKDFLLIEGSTTGITKTAYNNSGLVDVYTIDGTKRLSKASTDEINALPKGVYIVNGKKIIIK